MLIEELNPDWAGRPLAFSERGAQITLVPGDPVGGTLGGFLEATDIKQFLSLAVGFTTTLEAFQERELIHTSVKPTNVLAHSLTDQAGLMDFGSARALGASTRPPNPQASLPGQCLTWLLNELGERIARSTREATCMRSRPYFAEMLNGDLPFTASDPVEWVHCQIARHPVPAHDRAKGVPACVSAIVMKLDANTPEEPDQCAGGMESDLRRRVAEWEPHKFIADASPAYNGADCLLFLERLYGRARELAIPFIAFGRVLTGGHELVLCSGYSGIDESAIVNESPKPLVAEFPQQQAQRRFLAGASFGIVPRVNWRRSAHSLEF